MEFFCMTGFYRGQPTESKSEYGMEIGREAIGHDQHRSNSSDIAELVVGIGSRGLQSPPISFTRAVVGR